MYILYVLKHTSINYKKMRAQFPYNCAQTLTFLINLMTAYQAETRRSINTEINYRCL